jgi:hypothetical protein
MSRKRFIKLREQYTMSPQSPRDGAEEKYLDIETGSGFALPEKYIS